jgi:hypothetical protein
MRPRGEPAFGSLMAHSRAQQAAPCHPSTQHLVTSRKSCSVFTLRFAASYMRSTVQQTHSFAILQHSTMVILALYRSRHLTAFDLASTLIDQHPSNEHISSSLIFDDTSRTAMLHRSSTTRTPRLAAPVTSRPGGCRE